MAPGPASDQDPLCGRGLLDAQPVFTGSASDLEGVEGPLPGFPQLWLGKIRKKLEKQAQEL